MAGNVAFPWPAITNGDPEDVDKLMQNLTAILGSLNNQGLLVGVNILAAPASPISGQSSTQGSSQAVAAADHDHVVRGCEALAGFPNTGNFKGRWVYNTLTDQLGVCINTAGAGTWIIFGNPGAADLVHHAANHSQGGADALANGAISAAMMGRVLDFDAILPADANCGNGSFLDIWTGISFTCHGSQSVHFEGQFRLNNGDGASRNMGIKMLDTTAGGAGVFLKKFSPRTVAAGGDTTIDINWRSTFADGAHTVKLMGFSAGPSGQALKQWTSGGDAAMDVSFLQVMVG